MTESQTKRIQLLLPAQTIAGLDELVEKGHFSNRQDAARFLLKNGIEVYEKSITNTPVLNNDNHETEEGSE